MDDEQRTKALARLCNFIQRFTQANPGCSKDVVAKAVATEFGLQKERSVYAGDHFSVRFSTASGASFSNVVISLSALSKYDHLPFVICIVRPTGVQLLLANTTLLKKISHSSHQLRVDNVKGSILGHDIMRSFGELENTPYNFESLFLLRRDYTWQENLARLVEATNAIAGTGVRFEPSTEQVKRILEAATLANSLLTNPDFQQLQKRLIKSVTSSANEILEAAEIDNVNLRGNCIEQIITKVGNLHLAEDITEQLPDGTTVNIDVKTKLVGYGSSPKAYNIDKLLKMYADGKTAFCFLYIAIDKQSRNVSSQLLSVLNTTILAATRIQFHWAGRNSRGVTQLTGDLNRVFEPGYREVIDVPAAQTFLTGLIEISPETS